MRELRGAAPGYTSRQAGNVRGRDEQLQGDHGYRHSYRMTTSTGNLSYRVTMATATAKG